MAKRNAALTLDVNDTDAALGAQLRGVLKKIGGSDTVYIGSRPDRIVEVALRGTPRGKTLSAALDRARQRGSKRAAEILAGDEMLSAQAFADLLGLTRQAIDNRRQRGLLIGLDGPARGYKYPAWQIDPDGQMVRGLADVLRLAGGQPWTAYRHLVEAFPDGSGDAVYQKLRAGQVQQVLRHLESIQAGAPA